MILRVMRLCEVGSLRLTRSILFYYDNNSIDHAASPLPFQKSKSRRPRRPGRQSAGLFGGQDLLKAASSQSPIISTLDDTDNGDTIVQQDQQPAAPFPRLSLIKPKTQIAQLGMDRWMEFMKDEEHTAGNGRTVVAEHES